MCAFNFPQESKVPVPDSSWIDRYGIPLAFLALIVWMLAKLGAMMIPWLKQQFEKGFDRHLKFLDETALNQTKANELLERIVDSQERQATLLEKHSENSTRQTALYEQQSQMLDRIERLARDLENGDQREHWDGRFEEVIRNVREQRDLLDKKEKR